MKNKLSIIILFIGVILALFFSGSHELAVPLPDPPPPSTEPIPETSSKKWQQMIATDIDTLQRGEAKTGKGRVYVVSFHPQGQTRKVDEVDEINITFSEPVAPLKKVEKDAPSLIEVKPHLKGEGYWKSSTTYCFRIDEKLKLSSRYNIRFKGYTAFTGKIAAAKAWFFTTPTITILSTKPYHRRKWQTLNQKTLVRFSQDVDPNKIGNYINIVTPAGKHPFTARYANKDERKLLYYWSKDEKDLKK